MTARKKQVPVPRSEPYHYRKISALAAYVDRIAAGKDIEQRNFLRIAILGEREGGYRGDLFSIRLTRDGTVVSRNHDPPTEEEQKAIREEFAKTEPKLPKLNQVLKRVAEDQRHRLKVASDDWFVLLDASRKNAIMCQQYDSGGKFYVPYTFWSDGKWRAMEPYEDLLPLWKPERSHSRARIMIHEGAAAARHVDRLVSDRSRHPWIDELSQYAHWGWVGGDYRPEATNWSEVLAENPTKVVIVCDNDAPGVAATPRIVDLLGWSVDVVRFDDRFEVGHNLAKDLPAKFWKKGRYVGSTLDELTFQEARP